jgi:hypothetical protein
VCSTRQDSSGFTAADVENGPNIIVPEALKEAQQKQQALSMEPPPGYSTVPISELPRPNAKAQKRLQSALNKVSSHYLLCSSLLCPSHSLLSVPSDSLHCRLVCTRPLWILSTP